MVASYVPQPTARLSRTQGAPTGRCPRRGRSVVCQAAQPDAQPATGRATAKLIGTSRRSLLLGGVAAGLCSCCPTPAGASEWNYTCPGPEGWGGMCAASKTQSPVDIRLPPRQIIFDYPQSLNAVVINNGHGSPQVNIQDNFTCQLGNDTYKLVQFHFHAPSEHTFDGKHAAMEVHLVHKNIRTGELAVLGTMLDPGADLPNPAVEAALGFVPPETGVEVPISAKPIALLTSLVPRPRADGKRPYASYEGSLTTPPCSEGVKWFVFMDPVQVQATQVLQFMTFAGGKSGGLGLNARPVQPLGDRQLQYFI